MRKRGGRLLPSTRRALYIIPLWSICLIWMWSWWLNPSHIGFLALFIPLSLALLYEFALLPSVFLFYLFRIKYPAKRRAPKNKEVAVITLCVPSKESIYIIERQLKAMSEISYPHDSWVLDEGNSQVVKKLAKRYGVKHFSRKGVDKYNQEVPPFKSKTKAGNVNAWLDHSKRYNYEYFVQFDIDHLAKPNYLDKTLGHFRDPLVAWVQAPSVYKNHVHWTARGSSEQELVLQGPLQMGFYGHSQTPFIIGSHCTYLTKAVREIGGFQPTRAEDHLDTVMLASIGYKGVFVPEVIAEGDGPESLSTYLDQQFAWAYSMFQVLVKHSPKLIRSMPMKRKLQFLFSQTWYPLWSTSYFITFLVPVLSLVLDKQVVKIHSFEFVDHFVPLFICSFLVWWCARPVMQPKGLYLSWRGMLLHVVRWPVVLKAVISAARGIKKPYMITPKGKVMQGIPTVRTYRPFMVLGLIGSSAVVFASLVYKQKAIESQIVFALTNALFMATICLVDLDISLRSAKGKLLDIKRYWLRPIAASISLAAVVSVTLVTSPLISSGLVNAISKPVLKPSSLQPLASRSTADLVSEIAALPSKNDSTPPSLGIYSLDQVYASGPYIRHSFVDWRDPHYLAEQLLISEQAGDTPLITIEPRGVNDGQTLLTNIANGTYDDRLNALSAVLAASNRPVYIRFAHEMELANLYPWGNQDPNLYISAYRHFVDYLRSHGVKNAKFVWSPGGNYGAEAYYPGDSYVDVIGVTVLYDQYWYGDSLPSFEELVSSRLRLQVFNKPIWIVEFGSGKANPTYQSQFISQALSNYKADGFSALVYLDIKDSNIQGPDYSLSNISILGYPFVPVSTITPTPVVNRAALPKNFNPSYQNTTQPKSLFFIK